MFYDREPLALQCCLLSAELNGLDVSVTGRGTASGGGGGGDDEKSTRLCDAETFDWNAVPADQRTFDLVLACDVLYEPGMAAPVASLVPTLTRRGGGRWVVRVSVSGGAVSVGGFDLRSSPEPARGPLSVVLPPGPTAYPTSSPHYRWQHRIG